MIEGSTKVIQSWRKKKELIPSSLLLVSDSVKPAMVLHPGGGRWFQVTAPLPQTHSPNQPPCALQRYQALTRYPLLRGLSPRSEKPLLRTPKVSKTESQLVNFNDLNLSPLFSQFQAWQPFIVVTTSCNTTMFPFCLFSAPLLG